MRQLSQRFVSPVTSNWGYEMVWMGRWEWVIWVVHALRVNGNGGAVGERLEKSWTPGRNDNDYGDGV